MARAALQEPDLPRARLAGAEREVRLLVDHDDDLAPSAGASSSAFAGTCTSWSVGFCPRELGRAKWLDHLQGWLARQRSTQARVCRTLVARLRVLLRDIDDLEREITGLFAERAGALLAIPDCGPLTAAKLIGEVGDVSRFPTAAKLGCTPEWRRSRHPRARSALPAQPPRQPPDALHRIAVNQGRWHPDARAYLACKQRDGKSRREAVRALKRHLASAVYRAMGSMAATSSLEVTAAPALA